ncbi:hypothetical protein TWF217_010343 [Orbilia oligospora]|nr:hypothetical protein TWF217_010343 [Orbilia oligospora]
MEEFVTLLSKVFGDLHYEWKRGKLKEQIEKIAEPNSHKLHFKGLSDRANIILNERENGQVAEWLFDDNIYQSRRDHGKSMAMLCLRKSLELGTNGLVSSDNSKSAVLYFFFKRGDHELQNTRTALETILYQLLNRVQRIEDNEDIIDGCISILNPELRESNGVGSSGMPKYDSTDIKSICESIRIVASRLHRVYILVDALDECNDRQEGGLVQLLKSIAYSGNAAVNESNSNHLATRESCISANSNQRVSEDLEPWIGIIEITAERNSPDLNAFLQHDVKALLTRRIDPNTHPELYNSELIRISSIILKRANGDFALARMFIAHLQQPSKLPLNEKLNRLPDSIGQIYMTALESLTADQQELIITVLKWVFWGVSGITTDVDSVTSPHSADTANVSYDVVQGNPEDDPEIKNTIYHLETVGQDFFRIKKDTNLIDVDISIRDVQVHADSYEVDNWHIHLKILDKWWISGKSHLESKWSDPQEQIFIFMKPKNWYRWILLVYWEGFSTPTYSRWDWQIVSWLCQHPIHIAATFGLQIVIDLLLGDNNKESKAGHQEGFKIVSTLTESGAVGAGIEIFETYQKDVQNIPEVDLPMGNGSIPLYLAAPYPGALQSLIKYGASVNAPSRRGHDYNEPVLLCVLSQMANHEKNMDISTWIRSAKILVSEGARVDATDESGATALHYAAKIQDLDFFKFILISAHQNIHAVDKDLKTPLHYLFSRRPPDDKIQMKVIELGVGVHDDDASGNTSFHHLAGMYASSSTLEVAQLLDTSNLDFKRTNKYGETALVTAFCKDNEPMIEFLLEKYRSLDGDEAQPHPILASDEGRDIFHYMAQYKTSWGEATLKSSCRG